jgi:hypothetical protein
MCYCRCCCVLLLLFMSGFGNKTLEDHNSGTQPAINLNLCRMKDKGLADLEESLQQHHYYHGGRNLN